MNIAIVGAFDRMNYGDILFPVVLNRVLTERFGDSIKIAFYGHRVDDLSAYGGFKTRPMRDLFDRRNKDAPSVVIVAGGEVLSANWRSTLFNLLGKRPWWQKLATRIGGTNLETTAIRRFLGCRNSHPYLFKRADFPNDISIIYNAVGGSNLQRKDSEFRGTVANTLLDASYLAVRDRTTQRLLEDTGVELTPLLVTPDSASVVSDLFRTHELNQLLSREGQEIKRALTDKPFLAFQIGMNFIKNPGDIALIAEQLDCLSEQTGCRIILLPIGRASGHDDQKALFKVKSALRNQAILPESNTIYDSMWTISNSKIFIGTSLHGAITAMAYEVPHLALTLLDSKIPAYLDTWDIRDQRDCVPLADLCNEAQERLLIDNKELRLLSTSLKSLTYSSLENICSIISSRIS